MTTPPTIETERLRLRFFSERDADLLADINADEEGCRFTGGTCTKEQSWRRMAAVLGHWHLRGFGIFAVCDKINDELVGCVGPWRPYGWPENEIAYTIARHHYRKGYASEAARAALAFAYQELGWTTAISLINPANTASQGVAKKLGATLEKTDIKVNEWTADVWRHLPPHEFKQLH